MQHSSGALTSFPGSFKVISSLLCGLTPICRNGVSEDKRTMFCHPAVLSNHFCTGVQQLHTDSQTFILARCCDCVFSVWKFASSVSNNRSSVWLSRRLRIKMLLAKEICVGIICLKYVFRTAYSVLVGEFNSRKHVGWTSLRLRT
jgi:hypothetical protein